MLTNGILLDDAILAALAERDLMLMISLDGIGDVQDNSRPFADGRGSFAGVERGIMLAKVRGLTPHISISVTSTTAPALVQTVTWLLDRDLPFSINFYRSPTDTQTVARQASVPPSPRLIIEGLQAALAILEQRLPASSVLAGLLDRVNLAFPHPHPCSAGQDYLVIGTDGDIAACQMQIDTPLTHVGASDPLGDLRREWQRGSRHERAGAFDPACSLCPWARWCASGCPLISLGNGQRTFKRGALALLRSVSNDDSSHCPLRGQTAVGPNRSEEVGMRRLWRLVWPGAAHPVRRMGRLAIIAVAWAVIWFVAASLLERRPLQQVTLVAGLFVALVISAIALNRVDSWRDALLFIAIYAGSVLAWCGLMALAIEWERVDYYWKFWLWGWLCIGCWWLTLVNTPSWMVQIPPGEVHMRHRARDPREKFTFLEGSLPSMERNLEDCVGSLCQILQGYGASAQALQQLRARLLQMPDDEHSRKSIHDTTQQIQKVLNSPANISYWTGAVQQESRR